MQKELQEKLVNHLLKEYFLLESPRLIGAFSMAAVHGMPFVPQQGDLNPEGAGEEIRSLLKEFGIKTLSPDPIYAESEYGVIKMFTWVGSNDGLNINAYDPFGEAEPPKYLFRGTMTDVNLWMNDQVNSEELSIASTGTMLQTETEAFEKWKKIILSNKINKEQK